MPIRVLTSEQVFSVFPMSESVEFTEKAFMAYSSGLSKVPLRANIHHKSGDTLFMPGCATTEEGDLVGIKIVGVRPGNRSKRLPTVPATFLDVDEETGLLKSIVEGTSLTYLRTGASNGVAAKYFAREDSKVLLVCGCGFQGRAGTEAILCVRPGIEKVFMFDLYKPCVESFGKWLHEKYPHIVSEVVETPNEAVPSSDIILTATTSKTPLFDGSLVKPGTHISGVGAYTPEMQEIPSDVIAKATCIADTLDGCLSEAGDFFIPHSEGLIDKEKHVKYEIGMVALGKAPGRKSSEEITFFKTVGSAVQDVVVGHQIGKKAAEEGVGTEIEM
ncbi:Ornithine cyclodeaminase [Aduncisulcus paluster]|uniref:Ornithine cyclodeaminase n=1 Tax=Aduncisulcus paluster TaxID=2918883 RepID=A0ABQ5KLC9_9EUKA|nr:Ornithine cyclodeaminase [Aduncisulcus paluster]|eukprot:gnl/Carplike_NY0171/1124_a1527_1511.p1 GENE.gnl/Carplike_NY0171/1124_a1527_1511~~gnl/Carplike_NY0171/1124_a1527_1511.p1  ORF type:complete len:331 (+),score=123.31 gnl/Carplike_NY0171/1124_a1527_1511:253-1245(+)